MFVFNFFFFEKQALLAKGFPEWKKPEWQGFVRGMELYGRDALEEIAAEVGKPVEDVKKYHAVFWRKYKTLPEWEKVLVRVERGDKRREAQKDAIELLKTTFSGFDPLKTNIVDLVGSSMASKDWTPENDLWLLVNANAVGYGNWTRLQHRVASHPGFAMDWFMQSRTADDLKDRVDKLLKNIMERSKRKSQASAASGAVEMEKKKAGRKRVERGAEEQAASAAAEKPAKEKAKRVKKDTGPEKNLTPYKFFQKEFRATLTPEQLAKPSGDITKLVTEAWKALADADKQKYVQLADADAERYEREYAAWEKEQASKPPPPPASTSPKKKGGAPASAAPLGPAPPAPAKPPKAYVLFSNEKRPEVKQQNPTASAPEMMKLLGARWTAAPEEEKKKFNDRAAELKAQYIKDMAAWRKKYPAHAKQMDKELAQKKEASKKKREAKKISKKAAVDGAPAPAAPAKKAATGQTKIVATKREPPKAKPDSAAPPEKKKPKKEETK